MGCYILQTIKHFFYSLSNSFTMKNLFHSKFFSTVYAFKILFGDLFNLSTSHDIDEDSRPFKPDGVSAKVSTLAQDLFEFKNSFKVPEGLSRYVELSSKAQADWYRKLLKAWKQAKHSPKTPEEAASLVIQTLAKDQKAEVEGLLAFYGLFLPDTIVEISIDVAPPLPKGVKFEWKTLPVDARSVADGDGLTVYISTADPIESLHVPITVKVLADQFSQAQVRQDYEQADMLHQEIIDAGYRMMYVNNVEILARKHRIRLRGIDAPENAMPYGREAKEALVEIVQGKCLSVQVYEEDQYRRYVADVYCNGILVQELMLKKGLAWHYSEYDQRKEFAEWEEQARKARRGLWMLTNPEKPWDWRKKQRERERFYRS